jgi:excisionase family DNA binding protein
MTIIRMLHSKQIYGFKIGEKSWRIPISAVHEYEEKGGSK